MLKNGQHAWCMYVLAHHYWNPVQAAAAAAAVDFVVIVVSVIEGGGGGEGCHYSWFSHKEVGVSVSYWNRFPPRTTHKAVRILSTGVASLQSFTTIKKTEISARPEFLKLVSKEFEHQPEFLNWPRSYTAHVKLNISALITTVKGHELKSIYICIDTLAWLCARQRARSMPFHPDHPTKIHVFQRSH